MMDRDRVARSLKRISYQIVEANRTDRPLILAGLGDRGGVMAAQLAEILAELFQEDISTLTLPKDGSGAPDPELFSGDPFPLVVDDVIFTGETMFKALNQLSNHMDMDEVHTVALVDRGHRKFPVLAEFVGMNIPTKLREHVSVKIENGVISKVVLELH